MLKIFIVILNWNQPKLTLETIESVSRLLVSGYQLEVVVVDNASTDNSVEKLQSSEFRLLVNKENLGFAGGNNVGVNYALENGADWVLVLNNDVRVDKNLVIEFLKVAKKYKKVGAISPKIYFEKGYEFHKDRYKKDELGRVIWYAGGNIDWDNVYGTPRGIDEVDEGQYEKVEETDYATGTAMFLSAKALKQVGVFYAKYFMYLEDTDLSVRMEKAGWRVMYAPKAIVWHKVAQSSSVGSKLNDYFIIRNRMLFGMLYARFRTRLSLMKQAVFIILGNRPWQRMGIIDYFIGRMGRGSWPK